LGEITQYELGSFASCFLLAMKVILCPQIICMQGKEIVSGFESSGSITFQDAEILNFMQLYAALTR